MYNIMALVLFFSAFNSGVHYAAAAAAGDAGDASDSLIEKRWIAEVAADPARAVRAQSLLLDSWAENKNTPCWRFLELGYKQNWHECVEKNYGADVSALIEWVLPHAYSALNREGATYGSPFQPRLDPRTLPTSPTSLQFIQTFLSKLNAVAGFQKQLESFFKSGGASHLPDQEFLGFQTAHVGPSLSRNSIEAYDQSYGNSKWFLSHPRSLKFASASGYTWQRAWSFQSGNKGGDPKTFLGTSIYKFNNSLSNPGELSFQKGGSVSDLVFVPIARNLALYAWISKLDVAVTPGIAYLPSLSERLFPICERAKSVKEQKKSLNPEQAKEVEALLQLNWLTELATAEANTQVSTIQNLALQDYLLSRIADNATIDQKWIESLGLPLPLKENAICASFEEVLKAERTASAKETAALKNWKSKTTAKIRILSATLAPNMNAVYEGNLTQSIRSQCDGYDRCSYAIPTDVVVGVEPGLGFQLKYLCEVEDENLDHVSVKSISIASPAERKIVELQCVRSEVKEKTRGKKGTPEKGTREKG